MVPNATFSRVHEPLSFARPHWKPRLVLFLFEQRALFPDPWHHIWHATLCPLHDIREPRTPILIQSVGTTSTCLYRLW